MNILICDDDKKILDFLSENLMKKYGDLHRFEFAQTGDEFLSKLNDGKTKFDVLIMDICIKNSSGIDLACLAHNKFPQLKTVFITGYKGKVEEIFIKIRPYAYVSKPINFKLLCLHIDRLNNSLQEKSRDFLLVDNKKTTAKIPYNSILYFESQKRKLLIHTADDIYCVYRKISDLKAFAPDFFVRCHQSFLVNLYYVKGAITNNCLELITGQKIPISRSRIIETQKAYFDFLGGEILE